MSQKHCPTPRDLSLGGRLIRRFRKEATWTQEELAEKMKTAGWDIGRVVITRIETGRRKLFDYELKFFLDVFGKNWTDIVLDNMEPRNCPKPADEMRNFFGKQIRLFRTELGWSQEKLATKLQLAGWDVDYAIVMRIENGQRTLLDYELKLFLNALGKESISFSKNDTPKHFVKNTK